MYLEARISAYFVVFGLDLPVMLMVIRVDRFSYGQSSIMKQNKIKLGRKPDSPAPKDL